MIFDVFLAGITKENATMALDQSALTDLLDALRAGGDMDVFREAMQLVLQALIDLEAAQVICGRRRSADCFGSDEARAMSRHVPMDRGLGRARRLAAAGVEIDLRGAQGVPRRALEISCLNVLPNVRGR